MLQHTYTQSPLFHKPPPPDIPNHYDNDCSSLGLLHRQSWPRFHQITKMTSPSVLLYCASACKDCAAIYLLCATMQLYLLVYFQTLKKCKNHQMGKCLRSVLKKYTKASTFK
ncbi:hypothetical protein ILYODFUR_004099 [Ilyodon furcidens]|uniref:Uncharacterized protein n=1 Tax=Ilyodon furcidens TaxID=33524 RepID=A0ABV0VE60_9TELE